MSIESYTYSRLSLKFHPDIMWSCAFHAFIVANSLGISEQTGNIVSALNQQFYNVLPGNLFFNVRVIPEDRLKSITRKEEEISGGLISTYAAVCSYYGTPRRKGNYSLFNTKD